MNFEDVYKSNFSRVYKFFYYKFVNKDYIEDLAHDVFMRFYIKYGYRQVFQSDEASKILYGISNNIFKEWVRKSYKEKRVDFEDNYIYSLEDFLDKDYAEKKESQKKQIIEALNNLNPTVKYVLEARFLYGLTRKEIAEKLGVKEKDVHTYQKRGIKYLKKALGNGNIKIPSIFIII